MANNLLNQPAKKKRESFSKAVKRLMKEKGMTQSDLVERSRLPKTTISRILRNTNYKGGKYTPTDSIIMALSVALRLSSAESTERLVYAAFPERALWKDILDKHLSIHETNILLEENKLPLLGNIIKK